MKACKEVRPVSCNLQGFARTRRCFQLLWLIRPLLRLKLDRTGELCEATKLCPNGLQTPPTHVDLSQVGMLSIKFKFSTQNGTCRLCGHELTVFATCKPTDQKRRSHMACHGWNQMENCSALSLSRHESCGGGDIMSDAICCLHNWFLSRWHFSIKQLYMNVASLLTRNQIFSTYRCIHMENIRKYW